MPFHGGQVEAVGVADADGAVGGVDAGGKNSVGALYERTTPSGFEAS